MDDYLERYNSQRRHLQAFFQLRLLLAPLIEATILLDRLAFLKEQVKYCQSQFFFMC